MADVHFRCDGCGRIGTEDDGFYDDGDPCQDEECGNVHIVEIERIDRLADLLEAVSHIEGQEDCPELEGLYEAYKVGAAALRGLAIAYRTNRLWTAYGSSGADDAAFLYSILTDIGLEVP